DLVVVEEVEQPAIRGSASDDIRAELFERAPADVWDCIELFEILEGIIVGCAPLPVRSVTMHHYPLRRTSVERDLEIEQIESRLGAIDERHYRIADRRRISHAPELGQVERQVRVGRPGDRFEICGVTEGEDRIERRREDPGSELLIQEELELVELHRATEGLPHVLRIEAHRLRQPVFDLRERLVTFGHRWLGDVEALLPSVRREDLEVAGLQLLHYTDVAIDRLPSDQDETHVALVALDERTIRVRGHALEHGDICVQPRPELTDLVVQPKRKRRRRGDHLYQQRIGDHVAEMLAVHAVGDLQLTQQVLAPAWAPVRPQRHHDSGLQG